MKKIKCPDCGCDLKSIEDIGYAQGQEMVYDISIENDSLEYGSCSPTDSFGEQYFFCNECGAGLEYSEEEIVKLFNPNIKK